MAQQPQGGTPPERPRRTAAPKRRRRSRSAVDRVRNVNFPLALRGYDRGAVDKHLADMAQLVAELEATQLPDTVVQRALDQVGEQTAGVLQRAHETAEEIVARSRAQAEGRIQRAEREAEVIRQEAEAYVERVTSDARRLWEERQRIIEELRQFGQEVEGAAVAASGRLTEPPAARREPAAEPDTATVPAGEPAAAEEAAGPEQPGDEPPRGEPRSEQPGGGEPAPPEPRGEQQDGGGADQPTVEVPAPRRNEPGDG